MSSDKQPQEQPGPEWVESPAYVLDGSIMGGFHHPGLNRGVDYIGSSHGEASIRREEAIARCRAISAAALEWAYKVRRAERQAEREVPTMDLPQ